MRVLAISGSLRAQSNNTRLLREAARLAPDGVSVELYEGLEDLPPYNEDRDTETPPPEAVALRERVAAADALLISTPEYNGTVPGQLKHAVDWASRPYGRSAALWGKPTAVVGASASDYGAMWAQEHLRKSLGIAGGRVLDAGLALGRAAERFDSGGRLNDPEIAERLQALVEELVEHHQTLALAA
jgi:chromate reductase